MNGQQRNIVFYGLSTVASILPVIFLRFGHVYEYANSYRLLILTERTSIYTNDAWGLLARGNIWGVVLGIVLPIVLLAAAAYVKQGGPLNGGLATQAK